MNRFIKNILAGGSIALGSFLLFLVQPMIGNFMLPHFGGTANVWIVCLCTFQVLLIAGYGYAHFLRGRVRTSLHVVLLLVSAAIIIPSVTAALGVSDELAARPTVTVVVFLLMTVALPYVLVGANASLVQSLVATGKGSYRLYALSNAGSFLGLLSYPVLIEPNFPLAFQLKGYAVALAVYAILLALLLFVVRPPVAVASDAPSAKSAAPRAFALRTFLLSAASCFVLDSVSAHLCMDITPLPLLWCVILAIYLVTWSVAFTDSGSRVGTWTVPVVLALVGLSVWNMGGVGENAYLTELKTGLALLFFGCWLIHARLYAIRPDVDQLTRYYFVIAVGGAAGGVAASIVAPLVFSFVAEYPLSLAVLTAVALAVLGDGAGRFLGWLRGRACVAADPQAVELVERLAGLRESHGFRSALFFGLVAVVALVALVRSQITDGVLLCQRRSFYGTVKVRMVGPDVHGIQGVKTCLAMDNNGTTHGMQMAEGTWRGVRPTCYFTDVGGGQCLKDHPRRRASKPIRAAFLGLGVGTLASYGRKGDYFRFYEINPDVAAIAGDPKYFTFLSSCEAKVDVVVDDARKGLEREVANKEEKYDLIVVDVFSGDSIPAHMATREAVRLYLDRLKEDGILTFHLSNWHLGLSAIAKAAAREFGLELVGVMNQATTIGYVSYWAYFTRGKPVDFSFLPKFQPLVDYSAVADVPMMTDDFHPMIRYIELDPLNSLKLVWQKEE